MHERMTKPSVPAIHETAFTSLPFRRSGANARNAITSAVVEITPMTSPIAITRMITV